MNIPKAELIKLLNGDNEIIRKYKNLIIPEKICKYCGKKFTPSTRTDEVFCAECINISDDRKVLKCGTDERVKIRREYKRVYAHYMRGKITKEELDRHMKEYGKAVQKS